VSRTSPRSKLSISGIVVCEERHVLTQSTQRSPRILWFFLSGLGGLGVKVDFFRL
jgi:hypothetical protein